MFILTLRVRDMMSRNLAVKSLRNRRGMSTVEYAVLLALLIGGILLSVDLMGAASQEQFSGVATSLGGDSRPNRRPADAEATPTPESLGWTRSADGRLTAYVRTHGLNVLLMFVLGLAFIRLRRGNRRPVDVAAAQRELEMTAPSPRFVAKRQEIMRKLSGDFSRVLVNDLLVSDLMTTDVTTVRPDLPVEELAELMKRLDVRHMIVTGATNEVLGVCSDRDLSHQGKRVADIMTRDPLTVAPDASMRPAMSRMLERHISSLPVVVGGKLVGIVTTTDLVMAFQCVIQVVQAAAADLRPGRSPQEVSA